MVRAAGSAGRDGWIEHPAVLIVALVFVLLCLIPPDGALSDNEEDYFQLAARSVAAAPVSPESAVFDSAPHRFLADHLLGWLVAAAGFDAAQVLARALAAIAYALALGAVFRRIGLDALDAVLVVIVFALLGQTLFGGEWLFGGAEAKVAAYGFVLAGLAVLMGGKSFARAALLFAAATYFHFLVGIFWFFAGIALRFVEERRDLGRVAAATGLFLLLVAPLIGVIAWARLGADGAAAAGTPPPDVIYAIIRAPHHVAPFLDADTFRAQWLPGYLLALGMLVGCAVIWRAAEAVRLRALALWLALLLAYLVLALVPAYVDRGAGVLGKFYLFRPAALVLLLWLALVAAFLDELGARHWRGVRLGALALVAPLFLLDAAGRIAGDREAWAAHAAEEEGVAEFLAQNAGGGAVVLIDPQLEFAFLDFERRSGHPMLVAWKFAPTGVAEIVEWYRRLQFREALFAEGCRGESAYRVDFLLTTAERAATLGESCGSVAYRAGRVLLLRRAP